MFKTPFGAVKLITGTYINIYNSVVVIVGAVNMLKSHTNPVNISVIPLDNQVISNCIACKKQSKNVDKK